LGVVGLTPSISSSIINGSTNGLNGALTLTNSLNNTVLVRGANGSLSTVQLSGVNGLVGNTVTGVGGIVTGLGGTVSNLGGTLGGTVSGLGGTVSGLGGTVSGLGGNLSGTLNGLTGGLNGLLKH
jgi:hypothetical protein